jgi:type I restriction enzyme S subunit
MSDWTALRLGDHATTYAGGTPDRSKPEFFGGAIPWVKSTEVNLGRIYSTEESLTELGLRCSAAKWIPEQTVLVALYGATAAQVGFLEIKATANQAVLAILPDTHFDSTFLFYALTAAKARILFQAQGSGQPNLNKQIIDRFLLDTPPLTQQRKIARILTTVDNLIEKTEALIAKYQAIKQGMMDDLFSRGVDKHGCLRRAYEDAPELYKKSELGWIPKEWEAYRVGDRLERIEQGWSPDCESEPASSGEWGVLKTTAVAWEGFTCHENKRLPEYLPPLPQYEVHVDDVLMTRGGPNSRVGVVVHVKETTDKLMLSDKIYRLVPKKGLLPSYFALALSSERTQTHLSTLKTGLAESQTNISQEIVRRLWLSLPQLDEQRQINERLEGVKQVMQAELNRLAKLRLQKAGLMQDLLTGKVRVRADHSEEFLTRA